MGARLKGLNAPRLGCVSFQGQKHLFDRLRAGSERVCSATRPTAQHQSKDAPLCLPPARDAPPRLAPLDNVKAMYIMMYNSVMEKVMSAKVRKQIYIEAHQEAQLKALAEQTGLSEAEIIRQAINRQARILRLPRRELDVWDKEQEFIAQLMAQGPVTGGRTWTREELHDR
jgi:hypothetical protein